LQVEKMRKMADARRKFAQSAIVREAPKKEKTFYRQRCNNGAHCHKPGCTNLHPWDPDYATAGLPKDAATSLRKSRAAYGGSRGLKSAGCAMGMMGEGERAGFAMEQEHLRAAQSAGEQGEWAEDGDDMMRLAALSIDRILSEVGVSSQNRMTAILPLLAQADGE
jgi:hypothetical protein